ncbi:MAG: HAD family hydrolase [Breznakia sp.]
MIKLVCLDLDGTLLDTKGNVSNDDIFELKRILEQGILVYLVTGRPYCFAKSLAEFIDERIKVIAFNGASIEIGKEHSNTMIPSASLQAVMQILRKNQSHAFFKGIHNFYTAERYDERFLYSHLNDKFPKTLQVRTYCDLYWDELIIKTKEVNKILVYCDNEQQMLSIKMKVKKVHGIALTSYNKISFDIHAYGISKGAAVLKVANRYDMKQTEILCIGDGANDISMFEACGTRIAMGNAVEELMLMSTDVTQTNENHGVAYALKKHIKKSQVL